MKLAGSRHDWFFTPSKACPRLEAIVGDDKIQVCVVCLTVFPQPNGFYVTATIRAFAAVLAFSLLG